MIFWVCDRVLIVFHYEREIGKRNRENCFVFGIILKIVFVGLIILNMEWGTLKKHFFYTFFFEVCYIRMISIVVTHLID